jgi:hypothetical protein
VEESSKLIYFVTTKLGENRVGAAPQNRSIFST